MTFAFRWQLASRGGGEREVAATASGKWQVAAPVVATLPGWLRWLRVNYGLTFVLVFLPLCASHLAVRCVSCAAEKERERGGERKKIVKYATKARWNFKLSRGWLIRPQRGGASTFPPAGGLSSTLQEKLPSRMQISCTLPLHPIMLHSVGS